MAFAGTICDYDWVGYGLYEHRNVEKYSVKLTMQKHPVSFMRGLVLFYLIFLAVFFAAAPFLTLLLYAEADLSTSLLPQLIGFCLQGAFLVVIFAVYEKRSIINAKRSQKFALRTFLSTCVRHCVAVEGRGPGEHELMLPSPAAFAEGIDAIRSQGLNAASAAKLKNIAEKNLTSMESLSVVAAQIDYYHLEVWNAVINDNRDIRDSETLAQASRATVHLLEHIQKFDELFIH